ncbi:MAG: hypothetical protein JWR57_1240 [Mycetocola sp.]|nr:hypothetical protein [Mycetocola sp.]
MKRTSPGLPIGLAVAGGAIGWLLEIGLASAGTPVLVPPYSLAVALAGIAAILVAAGWPIRQIVQGHSTRRLDPFRAMRVLLLAKASTLAGSLIGGGTAAILLYLFSRPVLPNAAVGPAILAVLAAGVLVVAGLLVEHWCRVPPEDEQEQESALLQGE